MMRPAFAAFCCAAVLATSGTGRAEPACNGIAITDVTERASGELTPVGERCYERGPGIPFDYDAPGPGPRMEVMSSFSDPSSITIFEALAIEALGAQPIEELANPFPPGQGEAERRPE